jgi:hypothetical protein
VCSKVVVVRQRKGGGGCGSSKFLEKINKLEGLKKKFFKKEKYL